MASSADVTAAILPRELVRVQIIFEEPENENIGAWSP